MGYRRRGSAEHPRRMQCGGGANHLKSLGLWREGLPVRGPCIHAWERRHYGTRFRATIKKSLCSITLHAEAHTARLRRRKRLLNLVLHRAPVPSAHACPLRQLFSELLVPSPEATCSDNCLTANFHAAQRGCFSTPAQRNSASGRTPAARGILKRGTDDRGESNLVPRGPRLLVGVSAGSGGIAGVSAMPRILAG